MDFIRLSNSRDIFQTTQVSDVTNATQQDEGAISGFKKNLFVRQLNKVKRGYASLFFAETKQLLLLRVRLYDTRCASYGKKGETFDKLGIPYKTKRWTARDLVIKSPQ